MDPKALATLYREKTAQKAAATTDEVTRAQTRQAEFRKRADEGRAAMRDVVIPYLQEVQKTFPKGAFKLNVSVSREAETLAPLAVSFQIGDGAEHVIEATQGNVRVYTTLPPKSGLAGVPALNIRFVYSGNAEPFIAGPSDLTREKLGKLVELAIQKTD
jgi:hypothetical protein